MKNEYKRRILIIHRRDPLNPWAGGGVRLLFRIAERLVKEGHQVFWVAGSFPKCEKIVKYKGMQIIRLIREPFLYLHVPLFLSRNLRCYDIIVEAMAPLPFLVPLYARGKRIRPVVYHIAAKTFFVEFGGVKLIFGLFLWFLERIVGLVYKQYKFLTFSYSAKKDLVKLGISPCNIMVAQEGIELSNYIPSPFKESNPTLLMLGRLVKYKGVQYGILCLRILRESFPSVKMLIIGDGPYKQKLQSLAENVGVINNIKFLGKISESQKIEILGRAHLLLMCSLKEGWATPVIEANACGTIAVGFDVEGTRETIIHGKTGFLVPYGNVSELARVCNKLLEDRRIYGIMREECLKWSRKFELSRTIQQASSFILGN